jgi:Zn-finger nucleic acid-binding protein
MIDTLRCPSCGAPAPPDAARCGYCQSQLAKASCPSCFALLFEGSAFCPKCGAARSRTTVVDAQPSKCPACKKAMAWVRIGTTDMLECEGCDGTWVESETFERLCADREAQAAVLEKASGQPVAVQTGPIRYRPCPRCGKLMNRINVGRISGAIVDVCKGHGTFLDRGELHQVIRFIQGGGMERSREAQREQLVEEQRRLRDLERQAARTAPATSTSSWNDDSVSKLLSALLHRE